MDIRSETARERLKDSLEMKEIKRNILLWLILFPALGILMGLRRSNWSDTAWMIYGGFLAVALVAVIAFYAIRIFRIYRKPEHYIFSYVVLDQPRAGFRKNSIYFDITVTGPDGTNYPVSTHSIFHTRRSNSLCLENYINKTVTVAFNTQTGMVVVIG